MMEIRTDANGRKYEYHDESVKNKTELAHLRAEVASLKALSVTNILVDVSPGVDGMGHEVYAKSVEEVVALLTKLSEKAEGHENTIRRKNKDIASWIERDFANQNKIVTLTQQLAAANGRVERMRMNLHISNEMLRGEGIYSNQVRVNDAALSDLPEADKEKS